jgi:ubiquinone/menaquinone biosynthesis C-methylase UbiE
MHDDRPTTPLPTARQRRRSTAGFWDRIAKRYAKSPVADPEAYETKLAITREYLRPDKKVLELGCGTGSTAIAQAPYVESIRAVDISSKMIEIARNKVAATNIENVTFEQSSIGDLVVADESIDVVMAHSLLHLLPEKDDVIRRVYDMLRPNGIFVTSTTCLSDSMNWFRFIAPIGRALGLIPYVAFFSADQLRDSIRRSGFDIEEDWQPAPNKALFLIASKTD